MDKFKGFIKNYMVVYRERDRAVPDGVTNVRARTWPGAIKVFHRTHNPDKYEVVSLERARQESMWTRIGRRIKEALGTKRALYKIEYRSCETRARCSDASSTLPPPSIWTVRADSEQEARDEFYLVFDFFSYYVISVEMVNRRLEGIDE